MKINSANYSFIDDKGNVAGEAILFMKNRPPNADGTIGFTVEPDTIEALAWDAYFSQTEHDEDGVVRLRFPRQIGMFRTCMAQRKTYMVPARMPQLFDKTFDAKSIKPKVAPKLSAEMTKEERNAIVARFRRAEPKEAAE